MRTSICDMFGIDVPIFAFTHCRNVCAAVTAAGGMGVFGAVTFSPEELEVELAWLDEHCKGKPYGVDVVMADSRVEGSFAEIAAKIPKAHRDFVLDIEKRLGIPPLRDNAPAASGLYQNMELRSTHGWARPQLEVIWRHKAAVVVSALGPAPADVVAKARSLGMKVGGLAGSARHAQKHIEAGADMLVAAGVEGAGHNSDLSTMVLVPEVVDAAGNVPVLAGGGIGNGRQIAAAQALGAQGVWMGSVWLTCEESDMDEKSIELMLKASSRDTIRTKAYTGKPTRFLNSPFFEAWEEPDALEPLPTPLQRMLVSETFHKVQAAKMNELLAVPVGQVVGQMKQRRRVRDIMYDLQLEYADTVARMCAQQEGS
jgi:NAD(P)H-dependent flavin oxidoreductase YrpB (nitropropane dioxygenase family)